MNSPEYSQLSFIWIQFRHACISHLFRPFEPSNSVTAVHTLLKMGQPLGFWNCACHTVDKGLGYSSSSYCAQAFTYNPSQNSWATYVQTGPKTTPIPPVNVGRTNHSVRCAGGNNIAEGRGDEGGPTNFGRDCLNSRLEYAQALNFS